MATTAQRLSLLESWKNLTVPVLKTIQNDITALKARPAGTDYSAQIAALTARVTALEKLTCPQESRITALEG